MSMNERDLGSLLLEEFAVIAGALAGGTSSRAAGSAPTGAQFAVSIAVDGAFRGVVTLTVDEQSAKAFARAFAGDEAGDAAEGALRDAAAQVVAAVAAKDSLAGVQLAVRSVTRVDQAPSGVALLGAMVTVQGVSTPMQVGYYASLAQGSAASHGVATSKTRQMHRTAAAEAQQARLDVILDIDLPVVVRFGRTEMSIKSLSRLGTGSVIDLGRAPDDPVELLVSNRVVARGEVVVVGGNYGIRIVDVVSPSERVRSLEA